MVATWSDDSDWEGEEEGRKGEMQSVWGELGEGFRLVFFVALPMFARQLGSIISRRILTRLFG